MVKPKPALIEFAGWFRGTLLDDPCVRVDAFCEPLVGYCGDFIGLYRPSPTIMLGVIADACGHGAEAAALLEAAAKGNVDVPPSGRSPAELLNAVRWGVAATSGVGDGKFITAMVFSLDVRCGVLTVALAGHPPPLLVRRGEIIARPWSAGLPIGIDWMIGAEDNVIQLAPGDTVVAFTDGVADARSAGGAPLGFEGAAAALARAAASEDPVAATLGSLGSGQRRDWQADDTTAMFIRYGGIGDAMEAGGHQAWTRL